MAAELADRDRPVDQVVDAGERTDVSPRRAAEVDDAPHLAPAERRDGEDDLLDAMRLGDLGHARDRSEDRYAVDVLAVLGRVVVEEAHGLVAALMRADDLAHEHLAGIARADDE
jgi:hypothetical protein